MLTTIQHTSEVSFLTWLQVSTVAYSTRNRSNKDLQGVTTRNLIGLQGVTKKCNRLYPFGSYTLDNAVNKY